MKKLLLATLLTSLYAFHYSHAMEESAPGLRKPRVYPTFPSQKPFNKEKLEKELTELEQQQREQKFNVEIAFALFEQKNK